MRRLAVVMTGGTIESGFGNGERDVVADTDAWFADLQRRRGNLGGQAKLSLNFRVSRRLSEDLIPADTLTIAKAVVDAYSEGAEGVVITHGTDSMASSCAEVSFLLRDIPIPVIFTGSLRPLRAPGSDAPRNFWDAAQACEESQYGGVFFVFNGRGYPGTHVRAMRPGDSDFSPLEPGGFVFDWGPARHRNPRQSPPPCEVPAGWQANWKWEPTSLDPRVALLRIVKGFNPRQIGVNLSSELGNLAIILELYHSGTACTRDDLEGQFSVAREIREIGRPVVFGVGTPRRLHDQYVSTSRLVDAGMIPLGLSTPETAVAKAMYLLGRGVSIDDLAREMQRNLVGEFGWDKLSPLGQKVVRSA